MQAQAPYTTAAGFRFVLLAMVLACIAPFLIFTIYQQEPSVWWLPVFAPVLMLVFLWLAFTQFDMLFWLAVLLTPVSLPEIEGGMDLGVSLPNEPILVLLLPAVAVKAMLARNLDKRVLRHPLSIAVYIYLLWLLITTFTSTMPLVSFKFFLSRLWFIGVCYFFGFYLFSNKKNIIRFFWLFSIPLAFTIISTLVHHAEMGFERDAAFWVMGPYYKDHGIYAATVAFFIPLTLVIFWHGKLFRLSGPVRLFVLGLVVLFFTAIVFSFTRAAWLSLMAALLMACVFVFKIQMRTLLLITLAGVLIYLPYHEEVSMLLSQNKSTSGQSGGLNKQVESIGNISTDYSNLERINRWNSALSMWKDKPWFGFGAGTYIFSYAPYQQSRDMTPISTNFGDGGNSHSEYLNPLAETGLPGLITVVVIVLTFFATGMRVLYNARMKHVRVLAWGLVLGLVTYYSHGLLNNYSDSDKALVLIWSFAGMLVALDMHHKGKQKEV